MNDFSGIKDILDNNGIQYQEFPNYLKCVAGWREGDSIGSVTIYPELVIDHVTGEKYGLNKLIGKILNTDDKEEIEKYLSNNNYNSAPKFELSEPLIKEIKTIKQDFIDKLDKSDAAHSYWVNRGIDLDLLKELKGGVYKNKYYFPVYNSKNQCLGYSCRVIKGESDKHYLIRGQKKEFVYPAFVNSKDIIKPKKVYLVEGISDGISLMSAGIRNVLVLFGTECSFSICNYMLRIPDIQIVISVNSDSAGIKSSKKIRNKLCRYFDNRNILTILPKNHKDWNDVLTNDGRESIVEQLF